MPEHLPIGRYVLVAAVALFAAAAAQAAPKDDPAKDTGGKDESPAITLSQLAGTWKNAKSGVNVRIEQGAAGWEAWFSTSGAAQITLPERNRPAIKIDGRNFTCSYSVMLLTPQTMKWDLTRGQPESQCLTGVFTRLEAAPGEVKRTAPAAPEAKQAAKAEPAPVEQQPEVKKPPQAEAAIAPVRPRMVRRNAAIYRRPTYHRGWRIAAVPRWRYAARQYRPYRYFHDRYRWYVVFVPRCGCY